MAIKVYIDQGHNPRSYNTGAEGNGYFEQDITYRIGILLNGYFKNNPNFETRLSRPTPETLLGTSNSTSLTARVRDANTWGADLFLSLHTNASVNPGANGSECLIYSYSKEAAYAVAEDILEQMTLITGLKSRGVIERPGLYVLRRTSMPATVVEMGFITNPTDAELMANSPNLFALGIYRGVLRYYGLF
ncbi:MAG: N-acetylmuramoyl-L-alanine amidase [Ruminococcaceae bacterium]|nr:N-acetylmuramoyl-L-alanine amidase [Oscillospiraceae bacterium]